MILQLPFFIEVGTQLEEATGILQYGLVALFAAIPVVEILVVVPIAIGLGFDPVTTGIAAFVGNVGSVYALIAFQQRLSTWWHGWRGRARADGNGRDRSDRYARARRLWDRYGLVGLAFAAPVVTGVHLAALVAVAAGSRGRAIVWWMTVAIGVWTVVLVVASVFGLSVVGLV